MNKTLAAIAALAAFGLGKRPSPRAPTSRTTPSCSSARYRPTKRAIVLSTLDLTDAQVQTFTPIYDEYQGEMKQQFERGNDLINKFAANFGSMTDDAAKDLLKDFFKLRDSRNDILAKFAKKMEKALPATKVLQWVQVENKLNTLLDVQAAAAIPISR